MITSCLRLRYSSSLIFSISRSLLSTISELEDYSCEKKGFGALSFTYLNQIYIYLISYFVVAMFFIMGGSFLFFRFLPGSYTTSKPLLGASVID
jgi:hypothetical protein